VEASSTLELERQQAPLPPAWARTPPPNAPSHDALDAFSPDSARAIPVTLWDFHKRWPGLLIRTPIAPPPVLQRRKRYAVAQAKRLLRKTTALVPIQQLPPLGSIASLNPTTLGARFTRRVRVSLVLLHAPCYYLWGGCAATLYSVGRSRSFNMTAGLHPMPPPWWRGSTSRSK
jgi:hypothetical protein